MRSARLFQSFRSIFVEKVCKLSFWIEKKIIIHWRSKMIHYGSCPEFEENRSTMVVHIRSTSSDWRKKTSMHALTFLSHKEWVCPMITNYGKISLISKLSKIVDICCLTFSKSFVQFQFSADLLSFSMSCTHSGFQSIPMCSYAGTGISQSRFGPQLWLI